VGSTVAIVRDPVDEILEQWERERPDVDVSAMGIAGRIARVERVLRPALDEVFATFGLESWEFDVLATLRRSGAPFELTVGELIGSMMVTSGTMTNRIDRLVGRELVERRTVRSDGRVVMVKLTRAGKALINRALPAHAENLLGLTDGLSETNKKQLNVLLRKLLINLESPATKKQSVERPLTE
jgi:DNA-binding MarR family transcriptional regulator